MQLNLCTDSNTTVNVEAVSSDVIRSGVKGEKSGHTSNLFGLSKSFKRNTFAYVF